MNKSTFWLADGSGGELPLVIWGDSFRFDTESFPGPVVIFAHNVRLSTYDGAPSLRLGLEASLFFNPPNVRNMPMPRAPPVVRTRSRGPGSGTADLTKVTTRYNVEDLCRAGVLDFASGSDPTGILEGCLTGLDLSPESTTTTACADCGKPAWMPSGGNPSAACNACGASAYRTLLCLRARVSDATGSTSSFKVCLMMTVMFA